MAEIILRVQVSHGEKTLEDDLKAFQLELRQKMIKGLPHVREEMLEHLRARILADVYKKYTPSVYPRRKDNPEFGPSLIDFDAGGRGIYGQVRNIGNINDDATWAEVGFNYQPSGDHSGTTADLPVDSDYYDADNSKPLKPNPVHGDALIRRIETGRGYDWKRSPKARPFWQNFVDEMIEDNMLEHLFAEAMRLQGLDVLEDGSLVRETTDGEY